MLETDQELFERIAEGYSAKDRHAPSRRARRQRLAQTLSLVPLSSECRLIEVGCGAGYAAEYLRHRYSAYLGLDYSANLIAHAQRQNTGPGIEFQAADVFEFSPPAAADAVFMIGVLHHLPSPGGAVSRMFDWLVPGGWLVANEPQPGNPLVRWARGVRKSTDEDYSDEQLQLTGSEIKSWYEAAGLTDLRIQWQGVFSTPFAEARLKPAWLMGPVAALACASDRAVERFAQRLLPRISWNVIVAGRRPACVD